MTCKVNSESGDLTFDDLCSCKVNSESGNLAFDDLCFALKPGQSVNRNYATAGNTVSFASAVFKNAFWLSRTSSIACRLGG